MCFQETYILFSVMLSSTVGNRVFYKSLIQLSSLDYYHCVITLPVMLFSPLKFSLEVLRHSVPISRIYCCTRWSQAAEWVRRLCVNQYYFQLFFLIIIFKPGAPQVLWLWISSVLVPMETCWDHDAGAILKWFVSLLKCTPHPKNIEQTHHISFSSATR